MSGRVITTVTHEERGANGSVTQWFDRTRDGVYLGSGIQCITKTPTKERDSE